MFATDMAAATLRHGGIAALREWMEETGRARRVRASPSTRPATISLAGACPEGRLSRRESWPPESLRPCRRRRRAPCAPGPSPPSIRAGGDAAVPERGGRHVGGEHLRRPTESCGSADSLA